MKNYFLIFVLLYIKIKISLGQVDKPAYVINERTGIKSIIIGNKIVYIINNSVNLEIKVIDDEIPDSSYNLNIINHKDILKVDESNFIIIGLKNDNEICLERYAIESNTITKKRDIECYNIINSYPSNMEARYIENNKIIIYSHESKIFRYYYIDLSESSFKSIDIASLQDDPNTSESPSPFIKCDSFNGLSYFCIYYYKTDISWKFNYTYGDLSTNTQASGSICNDLCTYGNIIKFQDNTEKYLICYVKMQFSLLFPRWKIKFRKIL